MLRCHNRSPISDPFHSGILAGIEEVALDADYAVTIFGVRNRAREVLPPEEAAVKPVDGLIVLGIMSPEYLAQLSQNRIPSVGVEYHFEAEAPIDYVIQDCEASAFEVTRLLIERGHNRIAYLAMPAATLTRCPLRIRIHLRGWLDCAAHSRAQVRRAPKT
ncbi:MAG: substrate-binding domain-containing protein [Planctomycetota bacterium]|nr:substrate-binding domain-containing protein [Planctomycetota bacterium]